MRTKVGSVRASTAAWMRSTISLVLTTSLPGAVAAALGADLVFDVDGGGTGLLEGADGAGDREGSAPAGVDVDEHGELGDVGDAAEVGEDVFHGGDAKVGHAEGVGGDAAARDVEGAEAGGFGHAGGEGVDGADDLEGVLIEDGLGGRGLRGR